MISNALIIAMIVLFIHSITWDGMIFEKIKDWIKPEGFLYKPIYGCPICMTPWWGTLIYFLLMNGNLATWQGWQAYLLTIGAAAGFSVISIVMISIRDACLSIEDN